MVSASQLTNPLGATFVADGGVPRTFTAVALETISGGAFVQVSGTTGDVGSDAASYVSRDVKVINAQNIYLCNGIALNNAGSNSLLSVATRGDFLIYAGGNISGGVIVGHNASGAVVSWQGSTSGTNLLQTTTVGRAKSSSASGTTNFALIALNV